MTTGQRFLVKILSPFVNMYRWAIIGIVFGWFVLSMIFVFRMQSNESMAHFDHLKSSDPLSTASWILYDRFTPAEHDKLSIDLIFGKRPIVLNEPASDVDDPWAHQFASMGVVQNDPDFDNLRQNFTQLRLKEACNELEEQQLVSPGSVRCWLKEFEVWFVTQ
jgi:hypothetical protein